MFWFSNLSVNLNYDAVFVDSLLESGLVRPGQQGLPTSARILRIGLLCFWGSVVLFVDVEGIT